MSGVGRGQECGNDLVCRGGAVLELEVAVLDPVRLEGAGIVLLFVESNNQQNIDLLEDVDEVVWTEVPMTTSVIMIVAALEVFGALEGDELARNHLMQIPVEWLVVLFILLDVNLPVQWRILGCGEGYPLVRLASGEACPAVLERETEVRVLEAGIPVWNGLLVYKPREMLANVPNRHIMLENQEASYEKHRIGEVADSLVDAAHDFATRVCLCLAVNTLDESDDACHVHWPKVVSDGGILELPHPNAAIRSRQLMLRYILGNENSVAEDSSKQHHFWWWWKVAISSL
jgi:hypothetical protein